MNQEETQEHQEPRLDESQPQPIKTIPFLLYTVGVIVLTAGIIGGIYFISEADRYALRGYNEVYLTYGVYSIVVGIISGTLFIGFGKVVTLLEEIQENLVKLRKGQNK